MKLDNLETLLAKYYEGETTLAEEQELKTFFNKTKLLPDNLKPHAAQFLSYSQSATNTADKFIADDWFFQKIIQPAPTTKTTGPFFNRKAYWRIAASIALLLGAFWVGKYYTQKFTVTNTNEVAELRQQVRQMQQVLASATSPTGASASERIQVVSQEFDSGQTDMVIQVLTRTMNTDPNVNVRLAACEALFKLKDEALARQALLQALNTQTNPLMQITLIDMVIALQEKKAVEPLKKLVGKPNVLPAVKYKAQQGLGVLI